MHEQQRHVKTARQQRHEIQKNKKGITFQNQQILKGGLCILIHLVESNKFAEDYIRKFVDAKKLFLRYFFVPFLDFKIDRSVPLLRMSNFMGGIVAQYG